MRKGIVCTLVMWCIMNSCFGQFNIKSEWITVETYPVSGGAEQMKLKGEDALAFDIPTFIQEHGHLERLVIRGTFRTALQTTDISFDSANTDQEGDFICKEIHSELTPFLGVWGSGSKDHDGVDIKEVIANTAADKAGITAEENITEYNGVSINNFPELKQAVLASEIGDRVELKLETLSTPYSQYVTVGSRGVQTVTYKYCVEEQAAILSDTDLNVVAYTFEAYPNPTSHQSNVVFKSDSDEAVEFSVSTLSGKQLHSEVFANFSGELSLNYTFDNVSDGLYLFSIQQGKEVYKRKVQFIR